MGNWVRQLGKAAGVGNWGGKLGWASGVGSWAGQLRVDNLGRRLVEVRLQLK